MRRWRKLAIIAGFITLVPSVLAKDTFPLEGNLRGNEPMVLSGVVAILPATETGTALFHLAPTATAQGQRLMSADQVRIEVARTVQQDTNVNLRGGTPAPRSFVVTTATFELVAIGSLPQVIAFDHFAQVAPGDFNATVPRCQISDPEDRRSLDFPEDPSRVGEGKLRVVGDRQLEAACQATSISLTQPYMVEFYGMTLLLKSAEGTEEIRTGTFEEADSRGLPLMQTVTQILRVTRADTSLIMHFPFETEARFYSRAFTGVGDLGVGSSEGSLAWGDLIQEGQVEPFTATGQFGIEWGADRYLGLYGTTLGAPAGARGNDILGVLDPLTMIVTAAATGALILLLRLLWPLFTKLSPEKVLEHPRRTRILEFVREQPGVETNTVARTLGLRWANLVYHVGTLTRSGHITVRRIGGRTALFPANMGYRGKEEVIVLLRRETARKIHDLLRQQPGLDQASIAQLLDLTQQRISQTLATMEQAGLVRNEPRGRRRHYFANDAPN